MSRQASTEELAPDSERDKLLTSLEQLGQVLEVMGKLVVRLKDQAESLPNASIKIDQKMDNKIALNESTVNTQPNGKKSVVIH